MRRMNYAASSMPKISIIGAGIIGLSCAWELAQRGASVTVHDKTWPPRGASWAAAGMLAPAYEAAAEQGAHPRLFDLCMESARMWPDFAAELEAASGLDVGYHPGPSLAVAADPDQASKLDDLCRALDRKGLVYERLGATGARAFEPALSDYLRAVVRLPSDGQVDNRAVLTALIEACKRAGVLFGPVPENADIQLKSAGWEMPQCVPVKGQLLSLEPFEGGPMHMIQCEHLYIVPKRDRIVIGATHEPGGTDTEASLADTDALLDRAAGLCPSLRHAKVRERWAGLRPMTPDQAPCLGEDGQGAFIATGHYRNGILLAPVTAKIMADMMLDGQVSELAAAFAPNRFATA